MTERIFNLQKFGMKNAWVSTGEWSEDRQGYFDFDGVLQNLSLEVLQKIESDLEIQGDNFSLPDVWKDSKLVKIFISHLAENEYLAKKLANFLESKNIKGFVAGNDINPSREWRDQITMALRAMEAMITINMGAKREKNGVKESIKFSSSVFCMQEVGAAFVRNVPIIPIKIDELPQGFDEKFQACKSDVLKTPDVKKNYEIMMNSILANEGLRRRIVELENEKQKIAQEEDSDIPF